MKIQAIAKQLVALCRKAQWETAQKKLYAVNATSTEAEAGPEGKKVTEGRKAIIAKGRQFTAMTKKLYSLKVSDPIVADDYFACTMAIDMEMEGQGRIKMSELCVYHVKCGKIVAEHFHY